MISSFVERNFNLLMAINVAWVVVFMALSVYFRRNKYKLNLSDIVYQEFFQSGYSCKSILTKVMGARNCLTVTFLKDRLVIRPFFPFDTVGWFLDLDQEIPLQSIVSCKKGSGFLGFQYVFVTFKTKNGSERQFAFTANDPARIIFLCGMCA